MTFIVITQFTSSQNYSQLSFISISKQTYLFQNKQASDVWTCDSTNKTLTLNALPKIILVTEKLT